MAKAKGTKKPTKSDFLRAVLGQNPEIDQRRVNELWSAAGHDGEISPALYYQVRAKMGIKTVWQWAQAPEPAARPTSKDSRAATTRPAKPTQAKGPGDVYQFKITLLGLRPPIWRRIQVLDCSLDQLHEHIQTAMGWTNSHLNHFEIEGRRYGDPMLFEKTFTDLNYADSTKTMLHEIVPRSGQRYRFAYEYDFGDSWQHEVLFEGRLGPDPSRRYPLCLEGARACPPEDSGGVFGYADFVAAIADPENERHEDMLEWIGRRKFNPEAFEPEAATRRMKRGLPDWRSMP